MSCTGVRNNLKQFKKIHYQNYSLSSQLLFQSCRECILLITTRMLFAKFCLKTKIVDTTNKLIDWYHLDFWTFTGIPCKNYPLIKLKKKKQNKQQQKTPQNNTTNTVHLLGKENIIDNIFILYKWLFLCCSFASTPSLFNPAE